MNRWCAALICLGLGFSPAIANVAGYRLFGAMPYSVALYADATGNASSLSVVYANKGDFGSKADSGEDHFNGGTSVEKLLGNVRSAVYRKGRRTKDDSPRELRIRDVKRYIDDGIPVMWTMLSVPEYNKIANENTAKRKSLTDWSAYAREIAEAAKVTAKQDKPEDAHHICMIIGYNEATDEFAVSDSWGPSYERRWVPVPVADWASQGKLFMILP